MTEPKLTFVCVLEGKASELILGKQSDYVLKKGKAIGKSRAVALLLCELWNLKQSELDNKPCD